MVEYNTENAKLSESQLNKLKIANKNRQGTTLRMNTRMFSANNSPHELLLTTRQTTKLRNAIKNNMSTDIKLSKAQISKIIQYGGFLGKVLGPLLKTGLPLIKRTLFINAFRHFRSIFIRKFINRKRNYKSSRRNCKSWLWFFN